MATRKAQAKKTPPQPPPAAAPTEKHDPFIEPEVMTPEDEPTIPTGVAELAPIVGSQAIIKAEKDAMSMRADLRPRDPKKALARAIGELRAFPELARQQFYHLEFRMDSLPGRDSLKMMMDEGKVVVRQERGETIYFNVVEEVGIHGMVSLGRNWGNCSVMVMILEDRPQEVLLNGYAVDLETNFSWNAPLGVSKFYHSRRSKTMVPWRADRFPMVLAAGAAKAARNAIGRIIPAPARIAYLREAQALASEHLLGKGGKAITKAQYDVAIPKVIERFAPLFKSIPNANVLEIIEARFGKAIRTFSRQDFTDLNGIANSLEQGQADLYEAFGLGGPPADEQKSATTQPAAGDPLGGQVVKE